jgi:hypothetical protein
MSKNHPWWNTYDPLGFNRIICFPEQFEVRISAYAPSSGSYTSKFYHLEHLAEVGNVLRADAHSVDCSYACADLYFGGFVFRVEYAAGSNGSLACYLNPIAVADPFTLILIEVIRAWDLPGHVELEESNAISFPSLHNKRVIIHAFQEDCSAQNRGTPVTRGVYSTEGDLIRSLLDSKELNGLEGRGRLAALGFHARRRLVITGATEALVAGRPRETRRLADVRARIREAQKSYEKATPSIRGGPFEGCYRAVTSVMNWMTVWDQVHSRPYAPVSRSWIDNYMVTLKLDKTARGPLTGLWDSFFHTILHGVNDQSLAEDSLRSVLDDYALVDGRYPTNYMVSQLICGDRSQPPLGSLAAWKLYRTFRNDGFLEWVYPRLLRWRDWWRDRRDGNQDGLLEWGSNRDAPQVGNNPGTLFAAKCESGMDNSPLYDEVGYDADLGTMNISDVGLNALYTADALFLARIADAIGKTRDAETLKAEHTNLVEKINRYLWNEEIDGYMDRFWSGEFSGRLGPTMFYTLLACIPDRSRADDLVQLHLLNEREFWGEFVVPTISRDDAAFEDQLYWRGRVWPPVNYLIYLGLKCYGFDKVAHDLARRSVGLFMEDWRWRGHCHESYNAITGEGDDVPVPWSRGSNGSDRFYPWGSLLALMGIEELFDIELDEGMRFGCRFLKDPSCLSGIRVGGNSYSIKTSAAETRALRDGQEFFYSCPGTNVRHYIEDADCVTFQVAGVGETSIRVCGFAPSAPVSIQIGEDDARSVSSDDDGGLSFRAEISSIYTRMILKGEMSSQRSE